MAPVESAGFIIVAVAIIAFGLVSGRAERSVVTPPMAFVAIGVPVGPVALGLVDMQRRAPGVEMPVRLPRRQS